QNRASRCKSLRFAEMINVNINPLKDGVLKIFPNGDKLWMLSIKSKKAYSLSVFFDIFNLPNGAKLFIYNPEKKHLSGAFTNRNNKKNMHLAIAPVKGDKIIIEYFEPKDVSFNGQINISKIGHDYKDLYSLFNKSVKGFGSSGECNIDVNCDEGNRWKNEIRSVCKITYNGWLCSGSLINNARNDGMPYFLTANHCIDNQADADAAIFYFDYENDTCNGIDEPSAITISGAELIATAPNGELDFSLLKLSVYPPSEYNPYYAGWNREKEHSLKSTSIHHPSGDVKKISKDFNAPEIGDYGEGYAENSHWWIKDWEEGTTEGGSSGAPLFDENHRIIGNLTGGEASCSYNYNDYFAMFGRSWNDYDAYSNQLKIWLDPYNTGITTLNGVEPYDTIPSNLRAYEQNNFINLTWLPANDTTGFLKYYIYRDNLLIDSVLNIEYIDNTCLYNVPYEYRVAGVYEFSTSKKLFLSNKFYIRLMNPLSVPYVQDFELSDTMPEYWFQFNSCDTSKWEFKNGGNTIPVNAYEGNLNVFFQSNYSDTACLISPKLDFSSSENALLSFYIAMPEFNNDVHKLNIKYKEADSLSWKILKSFSEDIHSWQKQVINLPNLSSQYQVSFEGIADRGLGICLDSISFATDLNAIIPEFVANKTEFCLSDSVKFLRISGDENDSYYWNFGKDASPKDTIGIGTFTVKYNKTGLKQVSLTVNDIYTSTKTDIVRCMPIPPKPSFYINGDTLEATLADFYQWYLNGEIIINANEQNYNILEDGYYAVETINEYDCTTLSDTIFVLVNDIDYLDSFKNKIEIFPNPNDGTFEINIHDNLKDKTYIKIYDVNSRLVFEKQIDNINHEIINSNINQSGVYLIQLINNENIINRKIIIKKRE
nr:T9SS type A sorting domain-containing protein [Bacteroidales bacterium]